MEIKKIMIARDMSLHEISFNLKLPKFIFFKL